MNNRFLFINFAVDVGINHGIAYLSSYLKNKHSFDVATLDVSAETSTDEFIDNIRAFDPSMVGFSCLSTHISYLIKYSKALEKYPDILQIAGGPGPTLDPDGFLSRSSVKGVCIGEGEVPLDNLLVNIKNSKSVFDADGFYWLINGKVRKNPVCQYISDLSLLDFPDYSIFEQEAVCWKRPDSEFMAEGKHITLMLSRGCPNKCYYCCINSLRKVYHTSGDYFRVPSVEHSIELIKRKIEMYPETKSLSFYDGLLISKKTWFKRFAEEYAKKINLPYSLCVRAESLDPEIVKSLSTSGCGIASIGLESGNEHFRKHYLNRKYSNKHFIEACAMIKEAGIALFTFNMVGFPFETRKEMEDTLNLNREVGPNGGTCTFFLPFKGTKLYEICHDNNMLLDEEEMHKLSTFYIRPAIKLSAEQEKDCIEFYEKITNYLKEQRMIYMSAKSC